MLRKPTRSLRTLLRRTNHRKMSTTTATTIEHIVLLKIKPNTDPTQITSMLTNLNSLSSLPFLVHLSAGPIHHTPSPFTHLLHSRYPSKSHLSNYSIHPSHQHVVSSYVTPICDDIMSLDWVAPPLPLPPPPPGSAMRVQLIKLKDGVADVEKNQVFDVIKGVRDKINGGGNIIEQVSYGENFSPARAKGFSIGSISVFSGILELESCVGEENKEVVGEEKDKVRDYIDEVVVVDYVFPKAHSSSL